MDNVHSNVEIVFQDGTGARFTITATPSISKSLIQEAAKTGYFRLWNDDDCMVIRGDSIKTIEFYPAS